MLNPLGRYEILGLIATGGMGKVYLARVVGEGGFEREVAIKVMHEHLLHEADFVAMFLDEARLAARIRHPNVVPTIDVQKTADALFLVMELVEGLSVSAILKRLRKKERSLVSAELTWDTNEGKVVEQGKRQKPAVPLPLDVASRIIIDALGGLQAAHELADREGFVVVYPQGIGLLGMFRHWNSGHCCGKARKTGIDDVAFVLSVVDDVASKLRIDRTRLYVTGFSNVNGAVDVRITGKIIKFHPAQVDRPDLAS